MSDAPAGVEDEVEEALRVGLATATQVADRLARTRQELTAGTRLRIEQKRHRVEDGPRAEGASAVARLSIVDQSE